jgi:hypothetical protein
VRLGSQRSLINSFRQISGFDLVRIQALVLCFELTYGINNIISKFETLMKIHTLTCNNCSKLFETTDKRRKYCSRSCAAIVNNSHHPKNPRRGKCKDCEKSIFAKRVRCIDCHKLWKGNQDFEDKTLDEMKNLGKIPSNIYGAIRWRARKTAKKLGWKSCCKCGYGKHIEIAHKKAICDFEGNTLVSIINAESNLMPLCPNCHWEYDNLLV